MCRCITNRFLRMGSVQTNETDETGNAADLPEINTERFQNVEIHYLTKARLPVSFLKSKTSCKEFNWTLETAHPRSTTAQGSCAQLVTRDEEETCNTKFF